MSNDINQTLRASQAAAKAGNVDQADAEWRRFIGLLEFSMKRTGSPERLTPAPKSKQERAA